jgi:hypothetical protein
MQYTIQYQYKAPGEARPQDYGQEEELKFNDGEFFPIPAVGDSVTVRLGKEGKPKCFKVVSRHFSYVDKLSHSINIVVTDLDDDEYAARVKD